MNKSKYSVLKSIFIVTIVFIAISSSLAQITSLPGWPQYLTNLRPTSISWCRYSPVAFAIDSEWYFLVVISSGTVGLYDIEGNMLAGYPTVFELENDFNDRYALGDMDGDGLPELAIVVPDWIDIIYIFSLFPPELLTRVELAVRASGPTFADFEGDGLMEAVFTTANNYGPPSEPVYLHAMRIDGTELPGYPVAPTGNLTDDAQSPAIGDVDNDGFLEVCVVNIFEIFLWDERGFLESVWPQPVPLPEHFFAGLADPALVQINDTPELEIITGTTGPLQGDETGMVVYRINGNFYPGWPNTYQIELLNTFKGGCNAIDLNGNGEVEIPFHTTNYLILTDTEGEYLPGFPLFADNSGVSGTIACGDLDGDGFHDVFIPTSYTDNPPDGYLYAFRYDGTPPQGFPLVVEGNTYLMSPTYGDFNDDGLADFAMVSCPIIDDTLRAKLDIKTTNTPYTPSPWPMTGHDVMRTNCILTESPNFTSVEEPAREITPAGFDLQVYPNPFNDSAAIRFSLEKYCRVSLAVYDLSGNEVARLIEGQWAAGSYKTVFNASDLPSGIYFARLHTPVSTHTLKLILLK